MKKLFLFSALLCLGAAAYGQNDVMTKHNGEKIECKVVRSDESAITFKYAGEEAENTVGKYAVASIKYGKSGREEKITDKIEVNGEEDFEKVVILLDNASIAGLQQSKEIFSKNAFIHLRGLATGSQVARERLRKAAAKIGCPFILITREKDRARVLGGATMKEGIAFSY